MTHNRFAHARSGQLLRQGFGPAKQEVTPELRKQIEALCYPGLSPDEVEALKVNDDSPQESPKPLVDDERIVTAATDVFYSAFNALHPNMAHDHELRLPAEFVRDFRSIAFAALKVWRQYNDPFACPSCGEKGAHLSCEPIVEGEAL